MNVISPANPFEVLWRMGYTRLCPITPPGCRVSPTSTMARRISIGKDDRGKAPGRLRSDGLWVGMHDFLEYRATERDLETWRSWGAGVGIVGADGVCAIDADCRDPSHAAIASEEVEKRFGLLPMRVGRAPKALYPCRTSPDFAYQRIDYGEGERVELIAGGERQFVVHGVHPGTLRPYEWPRKLVPYEELPYADPAALLDLLEALKARLPAAREIVKSGGGTPPPQESLRGRLDLVREAVRATPNTTAAFPTRDHYRDYGYAIKAALPDEPAEAFEIFREWCERWDDGLGENDPETIESDWRRMRPLYRRGASWLYELAEKANPTRFSRASAWHEEILPEQPGLFPDEPPFAPDDALPTTQMSDLEGAPPAQRWLVRDFIPHRCVTLLYGDGGTGKSLAALQLCFAVATGVGWLDMPAERGRSLFITAEDEMDELHRRSAAIMRGTGLFPADCADMHLVSLNGRDAVLSAPNPKTGLMEPTPLFKRVEATVERIKPCVLVLDTLADIFGGDENKRVQARQFVQMIQGLASRATWDLSVIVLGHPSVAGMNSGTGTSGNTGWSNSVRSRLYLERRFSTFNDRRVEIDADVRVLSGKKSNRSRQGAELTLRWREGRFEVEGELRQDEAGKADEALFLDLLDEFERAHRVVGASSNTSSYAPRAFLTHARGAAVGKARLESAMTRLFGQSVIELVTYGSTGKTHQKIARIGSL